MADVKIFAAHVEACAWEQIQMLASLPAFADSKIRIMPDVHAGTGCVIGFTADLGDKVIPNIVGVDIGCGMLTVELGPCEIDFEKLDAVIRRDVPSGMNVRQTPVPEAMDLTQMRCYKQLAHVDRLLCSLGTLGGGNHFIEIDRDDEGNHYLVIHTGSRNLGKQVARHYQNLAVEVMRGRDEYRAACDEAIAAYRAQGRGQEIPQLLKRMALEFEQKTAPIPNELCYLTGGYREDYLYDMQLCQRFAEFNRQWIARAICSQMGWPMGRQFTTVHNYIEPGTNIVRKGAVSAKAGERLLIPMNMRDGALICIGRGNDDWNQSAPHGAGRLMSRGQARRELSLDAYAQSMEGVYTTSVGNDTLDEAPMAYKPMEQIIALIGDTAEIERIIRPVYNFKAGGD